MKLISILIMAFLTFGCESKTENVTPHNLAQQQKVTPPVSKTLAPIVSKVAPQPIKIYRELPSEPIQQGYSDSSSYIQEELQPIQEGYQESYSDNNYVEESVQDYSSSSFSDSSYTSDSYNSGSNYNTESVESVSQTQTPTLPAGYQEETKLKSIGSNIPKKCQMWTDGCNTCTRKGRDQAECTTAKCESNIKFSCLQWN